MEKYYETNVDIDMALLLIWSMLISLSLQSQAMLLLDRPYKRHTAKFSRWPMLCDNDGNTILSL